MKGMQEKEYIIGMMGRQKNPSLAVTVWQYSASLVMLGSDTRDGFFFICS